MHANQFLALADSLRHYAQHSGRDLNEANMFVHTILTRAIRYDARKAERPAHAAPNRTLS
ncbi:MAG: hypothetical protein JNK94_09050 [Hyphomonadaceae bacterium]|nr:hypothetical protein [Hyphomonadaceae bacterium]MBX3509952.1 hypothetical protein [Hyphomonadaceae bacterium]